MMAIGLFIGNFHLTGQVTRTRHTRVAGGILRMREARDHRRTALVTQR
jgi:hypothetical protein